MCIRDSYRPGEVNPKKQLHFCCRSPCESRDCCAAVAVPSGSELPSSLMLIQYIIRARHLFFFFLFFFSMGCGVLCMYVLSTPVVGHPLPISLSGNLQNGLCINTTMKKFFIFVQYGKIVLVLVWGTSERFVANCGVGPSTRGQGDSASLVQRR